MDSGCAVVIGARGFLGSACVRALEHQGTRVVGFTRERSFRGSARDTAQLASADTVFWLAGDLRPATAALGPDITTTDHEAMRTLLDAVVDLPGRTRMVVVSSGGTVYDRGHAPPHDESTPAVPVNAYGQAMLALENQVRARARDWAVLRVANAYGPGQVARRGQGVIAHWIDNISRDEPISVLGDDELARDYVYVDDVADALALVHGATTPPGVLNVGSGVGTGLGALLSQVRTAVAPREVRVQRSRARSFDAPSTWLSVERAASVLGWRAKTDLAEGLRRTWSAVAR